MQPHLWGMSDERLVDNILSDLKDLLGITAPPRFALVSRHEQSMAQYHVGHLDRVTRIVFVSGFVNAVDGFADSPAVINGASDLFVKVFGEAGKHARAAVAVNGLPRGTTVEVQVVAEVQ